jgi:small neutral amino acid transporter SnatA (MarC family)
VRNDRRREGEAAEQAVEEHVRSIATFALAIPLLAGPGVPTATVLLAGRAGNPAQNFYLRTGFRPLPECLTFVAAGSALAALANQDPEKLALTG